MKKLILISCVLFLLSLMVSVVPCEANWKTLQQIFNAVYNESSEALDVSIVVGTQTFTLDPATIADLKIVTVEGGTIAVNGIAGTVTTKGIKSNTTVTTGVDVSSATYTTVSARPARLSIMFKSNSLEQVFFREQTTNITSQGNFIDGGESFSRDDYTGAYYLRAKEGVAPQNIRIEEVYE